MSADAARALYAELDEALNRRAGGTIGFDMLLGAAPLALDGNEIEAWRARYRTIKEFQEAALALFKASLRGDVDPEIARMVCADLPESLGVDYHRALTDRQHRTPVFFRTDELAPGTLSEIQCPGSALDIAVLIGDLFAAHPEFFGPPRLFDRPIPERFTVALRDYIGADPVVHHLSDNSSRPQGMRYFIQRTREEGIRYFGWDADVTADDCNFARSHDFVSLRYHNFFAERMVRCEEGAFAFDLSPSALFDGKLIMAWPFWSRTRQYFSDEVRALFPYTSVVTPDGIELEDGSVVQLDVLLERSKSDRNYFLKYAGTDITQNWGSRAVFLLRRQTNPQRRELLARLHDDWTNGRFWVLQPAIRSHSPVDALTRDGNLQRLEAGVKWSAFYGPTGLLSVLAFYRHSHKVHGSTETVMSLAY